jgi:hypothetical protein
MLRYMEVGYEYVTQKHMQIIRCTTIPLKTSVAKNYQVVTIGF